MKTNLRHTPESWLGPSRRLGFTLFETMVAMGVVGMTCLALYSGMTFGVQTIQSAREAERATQIMAEKLDTARLYAWDKIATPGYIPETFTNTFAIADGALAALGYSAGGFSYHGSVTIDTNLAVDASYRNNLLQMTVTLNWTSAGRPKQTRMTSFVARHGLYSYIY